MGVNQWSIDSVVHGHYIIQAGAEVVEWQTRTFEGRVGKPVRVQIPPSAPIPSVGTLIGTPTHPSPSRGRVRVGGIHD
jgi:hypothetical protein